MGNYICRCSSALRCDSSGPQLPEVERALLMSATALDSQNGLHHTLPSVCAFAHNNLYTMSRCLKGELLVRQVGTGCIDPKVNLHPPTHCMRFLPAAIL